MHWIDAESQIEGTEELVKIGYYNKSKKLIMKYKILIFNDDDKIVGVVKNDDKTELLFDSIEEADGSDAFNEAFVSDLFPEVDQVPEYLVFNSMYRDGCNYKDSYKEIIENDLKLSVKEANQMFEQLFYDGVMFQDYGLESFAPMSNEFLPALNDYDHSYMELCDIDPVTVKIAGGEYTKLSAVVDLLNSPEKQEKLQKQRKQQAIDFLRNSADQIEQS